MKPHKFPQAFRTLKMPAGHEGHDLPTWTDGKEVLSCWRAGWRERLIFLFTGRVWLWVMSGATQPPVCVTVEEPAWTKPLSERVPDPVPATEEDARAIIKAALKRARKA
jgi:hypothetical protein